MYNKKEVKTSQFMIDESRKELLRTNRYIIIPKWNEKIEEKEAALR